MTFILAYLVQVILFLLCLSKLSVRTRLKINNLPYWLYIILSLSIILVTYWYFICLRYYLGTGCHGSQHLCILYLLPCCYCYLYYYLFLFIPSLLILLSLLFSLFMLLFLLPVLPLLFCCLLFLLHCLFFDLMLDGSYKSLQFFKGLARRYSNK